MKSLTDFRLRFLSLPILHKWDPPGLDIGLLSQVTLLDQHGELTLPTRGISKFFNSTGVALGTLGDVIQLKAPPPVPSEESLLDYLSAKGYSVATTATTPTPVTVVVAILRPAPSLSLFSPSEVEAVCMSGVRGLVSRGLASLASTSWVKRFNASMMGELGSSIGGDSEKNFDDDPDISAAGDEINDLSASAITGTRPSQTRPPSPHRAPPFKFSEAAFRAVSTQDASCLRAGDIVLSVDGKRAMGAPALAVSRYLDCVQVSLGVIFRVARPMPSSINSGAPSGVRNGESNLGVVIRENRGEERPRGEADPPHPPFSSPSESCLWLCSAP